MTNQPLLSDTFTFSQSSLQAFVNCPRRFWLAYVQQLPWPAIEAAPVQDHEHLMRLGADFHRLVERTEIGLDPQLLSMGLADPLDQWFDAYLRYRPHDLPDQYVDVEHVLSIPFGEDNPLQPPQEGEPAQYRLAAKYDLLAAADESRPVGTAI